MSHFFAIISRIKLINRWGLMQNTRPENLAEHSLQVAMLAHCLVLLHNANCEDADKISVEKVVLAALYHDVSEIITGDLPTPVKYHNTVIKSAYKEIEKNAEEHLVNMLPEFLQADYADAIVHTNAEEDVLRFVKAADKLSALIKCIEEEKFGNKEFKAAKVSIENILKAMNMPEVDTFMAEFLPSFALTLDEQE
ncbi:MAG: 5'-deoxynucleotidase [Oscillospiraceae bacterium]|jgi:5'-deoxynucleotidase|nr:5'-deoxynucleotidase [Oscillospiraceae bacterium]